MNLSNRFLAAVHLDFAPSLRPPKPWNTAIAGVVSFAVSLALDAALVYGGTRLYPGNVGYPHFRFFDYATLTGIGVGCAALVWPLMAKVSSRPRWLFFRLAVVVMVLLWIPDLALLLVEHEPASAVGVLMVMHLGVALVTYNLLVHVAPLRQDVVDPFELLRASSEGASLTTLRAVWIAVIAGVCLEFILGVASMIAVPFKRPNGWLPPHARTLYLVHAALGGAIGAAALIAVVVSLRSTRPIRIGAWLGLFGITVAAIGGMFSYDARSRSLAMVLMFLGSVVSCFAYITGLVETGHVPEQPAGSNRLEEREAQASEQWLSAPNPWWPPVSDRN